MRDSFIGFISSLRRWVRALAASTYSKRSIAFEVTFVLIISQVLLGVVLRAERLLSRGSLECSHRIQRIRFHVRAVDFELALSWF